MKIGVSALYFKHIPYQSNIKLFRTSLLSFVLSYLKPIISTRRHPKNKMSAWRKKQMVILSRKSTREKKRDCIKSSSWNPARWCQMIVRSFCIACIHIGLYFNGHNRLLEHPQWTSPPWVLKWVSYIHITHFVIFKINA
jgi:hypothetical protein